MQRGEAAGERGDGYFFPLRQAFVVSPKFRENKDDDDKSRKAGRHRRLFTQVLFLAFNGSSEGANYPEESLANGGIVMERCPKVELGVRFSSFQQVSIFFFKVSI